MDRPFFSVVLPTYNRENFISAAIKSVYEQSFSDWELIIIDDGSTDNTRQIVEGYGDNRIQYKWQENQERSVARNKGIDMASGRYVCFLDSDDYYLPDHLDNFYKSISELDFPIAFFSSGCYRQKGGQRTKTPIYAKDAGTHPCNFIIENNSITPISVCIHRKCFANDRFEENFKKCFWEDTHLWVRIVAQFPFHQLEDFTVVLTEHDDRSVYNQISKDQVMDHVNMVHDLFSRHKKLISNCFPEAYKIDYIHFVYQKFIYVARRNLQLSVTLYMLKKALKNRHYPKDIVYYTVTFIKAILGSAIGKSLN